MKRQKKKRKKRKREEKKLETLIEKKSQQTKKKQSYQRKYANSLSKLWYHVMILIRERFYADVRSKYFDPKFNMHHVEENKG